MTATQKQVMITLFEGGTLANNGAGEIRLRDRNFNPVRKVNAKTFKQLKTLLRQNKRRLYVYSIASIRKLHGSAWAKVEYKKRRKAKTLENGK